MRGLFDSSEDVKIDKPIRLIELFAGYGSQAMALKRLGVNYEHHFVCEWDKYAMKSYNAVHGTNFEPSDVSKIHGLDLNITDSDKYCYMLTYSFPCTDLSLAGKQAGMKKGSGTRSGLLWEVERILTELHTEGREKPQVLFMENVPQVCGEKNIDDFNDWVRFLESIGYHSFLQILNAKDYGVAQNRERAFMFSFLDDVYYEFPKPIELQKRVIDYLDEDVPEKYYVTSEKADKLLASLVDSGVLDKAAKAAEVAS